MPSTSDDAGPGCPAGMEMGMGSSGSSPGWEPAAGAPLRSAELSLAVLDLPRDYTGIIFPSKHP